MTIFLGSELAQRCNEYGVQAVKSRSHSNPYSYRGAEDDAELLAASKAAECVCAMHFEQPPLTAVRWLIGEPDQGDDLMVGQTLIDVKSVDYHDQFLIWSLGKSEQVYLRKRFHVMVMVAVEMVADDAWGECRGWIGKREFLWRKRIADQGSRLDVGTWHLHQNELHRMAAFPGCVADEPFEHYCWCGEWGTYGHHAPLPKPHGYFCKEHRP